MKTIIAFAFVLILASAEADLVLLKAGKPFVFVESKLSNHPTVTAGTYNAIADLKTRQNFVITPGPHKATVTISGNLKLAALSELWKMI